MATFDETIAQIEGNISAINRQRMEITQRRQALSQDENVASQVLNQRIPERKIGTSVTAQQQQNVIGQKKQAQEFLISSAQEKQKLAQLDEELSGIQADLEEQKSTIRTAIFVQNAEDAGAYLNPTQTSGKLREILLQREKQDLNFNEQIRRIQRELAPGEVLMYDRVRNKFGVSSNYFQAEFTIEGYNKQIALMQKANQAKNLPRQANLDQILRISRKDNSFAKLGIGLPSPAPNINITPGKTIEPNFNIDSGTLFKNFYKTNAFVQGKIDKSLVTQLEQGGLGFLQTFAIDPINFVYSFRNPKKASIDLLTNLKTIGTRIVSGEGFPEVGDLLRNQPARATGLIAGTLALENLPSLLLKVSDLARTFRLKEVPVKDIVAPEFFEGQRYPGIARGQTAGELLKEFKTPIQSIEELPGFKGAGFTASPSSFKKATAVAKGGSELPGLYQAPRLSATFLKLGGEADVKIFSLRSFDTLRPTALRLNPSDFDLVPGVSKSTRRLRSSKGLYEFFEKQASKGKSYLPFIKTEKEAVIPAGTNIAFLEKKFFFKFEGRRVPILKFKIADLGTKVSKFKSIESIYSRYAPRQKGIINPYSGSITLSRASSLSNNIYKSAYGKSSISKSYGRSFTSSSISSYISKIKYPSISSRSSNKYGSIRFPNYPSLSLGGSSFRPPRPPPSSGSSYNPPPIIKINVNSYNVYYRSSPGIRSRSIKKRRSRFADDFTYAPDLTSRVLNIGEGLSQKKLTKLAKSSISGLSLRKIPFLKGVKF